MRKLKIYLWVHT